MHICISSLVCFLWQLCTHLVNIRLNALITSVSAALVQPVRVFSLVGSKGQPGSPSDVVFPFFCSSLCVSLSPSVWKSHPSFSQEIPPRPRGETDREGVKEGQSRSATQGHSRPTLLYFSFFVSSILFCCVFEC